MCQKRKKIAAAKRAVQFHAVSWPFFWPQPVAYLCALELGLFFFFVRFTKFYRSGVYSLVARVCPSKAAVASQPRDSSVELPGPWIRPMCCRRSPDVLPGRDSASWSSCGGIPRLEQKRPRWDLLALPWGRCFPLACAAVGERVFDSQFLWHQARYEEVALFDRSARVNLFFRYNKG